MAVTKDMGQYVTDFVVCVVSMAIKIMHHHHREVLIIIIVGRWTMWKILCGMVIIRIDASFDGVDNSPMAFQLSLRGCV